MLETGCKKSVTVGCRHPGLMLQGLRGIRHPLPPLPSQEEGWQNEVLSIELPHISMAEPCESPLP